MRQGHSTRLSYDEIIKKVGPHVPNTEMIAKQDFCRDALSLIGCDLKGLVMGKSQIFFRSKYERFAHDLIALDEKSLIKIGKEVSFGIPIQQLNYITLNDTIFIMAASMILTVLRCSFIIMRLILVFLH